MKETILIILLILFIIIFIFIQLKEISFIEAYDSQQFYIVRNREDKKLASNLIHQIVTRLRNLIKCIMNDVKNSNSQRATFIKPYIQTIHDRFDNIKFREDTKYNKHTSYSINKGQEIVLCLRSKKDDSLHDINPIMYVAIHEIAHVGCPEVGHTPLFTKINKTLLEYAVENCRNLDIYKYKNYDVNPVYYCGIEIDTTLLNS